HAAASTIADSGCPVRMTSAASGMVYMSSPRLVVAGDRSPRPGWSVAVGHEPHLAAVPEADRLAELLDVVVHGFDVEVGLRVGREELHGREATGEESGDCGHCGHPLSGERGTPGWGPGNRDLFSCADTSTIQP